MKIILFFGLFISLCYSCSAAVYVISPCGDDRNAGTAENPWKSVQRSALKLQSGDTLFIAAGTYKESFHLKGLTGTQDRPIVIQTDIKQRTLFNLEYKDGIELIDGRFLVLRGLEVIQSRKNGITLKQCRQCTLEGNVIHDCKEAGILLSDSHENLLRGNVCYFNDCGIGGLNNSRNRIEGNACLFGNKTSEHADGIGSSNGTENIYRFNLLLQNNDDGLDLWTSTHCLVEYNLAAFNGDRKEGDGNGFKLGGHWKENQSDAETRNKWQGGHHTIRCNVAFKNNSTGFTNNGSSGNIYENNISYENRNTSQYAALPHNNPELAVPVFQKIREQYEILFHEHLIRPEVSRFPKEFDMIYTLKLWPQNKSFDPQIQR